MKRSTCLGFSLLTIGLNFISASNVFAAETPAAATAYANAKSAESSAQDAMDSTGNITFAFGSFGANSKPSKAKQATLAYKISMASSSAISATAEANDRLANVKLQNMAAKLTSVASVSYGTLANVVCPIATSCSPEAFKASQAAQSVSSAFADASSAARSLATVTLRDANLYKSVALAYRLAVKNAKISMSSFLNALVKADALASHENKKYQIGGGPTFQAASTAAANFDEIYSEYQNAP